MSWGQAAEAGGTAGESSAPMASAASSAPTSSGFTIEPASTAGAGNTPTDGTSVSMTPNQMQDVKDYGTSNPSMMEQVGGTLERFQSGGKQGIGQAINKFGNNAETYGYLYGKVNQLAGSGKQAGAAPITTNISTVQPENSYLKKRGRY